MSMKLIWERTLVGGRTKPYDFSAKDGVRSVGRIYRHDTSVHNRGNLSARRRPCVACLLQRHPPVTPSEQRPCHIGTDARGKEHEPQAAGRHFWNTFDHTQSQRIAAGDLRPRTGCAFADPYGDEHGLSYSNPAASTATKATAAFS
jgi:hypothetical protein